MTNLEILIDCVGFEESLRSKIILDNFTKQNEIIFLVDGNEYIVCDHEDAVEMFQEEFLENFYSFLRYVGRICPEYLKVITVINDCKDYILEYTVDIFDPSDITDYTYLGKYHNKYIFVSNDRT